MSSRSRVIHPPGVVLSAAALAFATVAVGVAVPGPSPTVVAVVGGVGLLGMAAGVSRGDRWLTALGWVVLLAGVLVAGATGVAVEQFLPSTAAAVLAWEFSIGAFAAQDELGGGTVERAELLHVGAATVVAALATGVAYVLYRTVTVGISPFGVVLLVVAVVALGLALRE